MSAMRFLDLATGQPYTATPASAVQLSSLRAGWPREVLVECASLPPEERPLHGILDHRVIVNLGGPVRFGWQTGEGVLGTDALCIQAHGTLNAPRWRDRLSMAAFALSPGYMDRLLEGRAPAAPDLLAERRCHADPVLSGLARRIVAALRTPAHAMEGEALCLALALHLLRAHAGRPVRLPRGRLDAAAARRVAERIAADPAGDLSVASLARTAGLSDAHFARLFRNTFGHPPHRYVLRWRVATAEALLREGVMSLPEVALAAGFCDQAHLTHAFRAATSRTPGAVRAGGTGVKPPATPRA